LCSLYLHCVVYTMDGASSKKRLSKRDRKLQKKGVDLAVDLAVVSMSGEQLYTATLQHATTVKTVEEAVQAAVGCRLIDRLVYEGQQLRASQTLSAAGVSTGATLEAVFGTLRADFKVERKHQWNSDDDFDGWPSDLCTNLSVQPGDRESLEEAMRDRKAVANFKEDITILNEDEHRAFLKDEQRSELNDEWNLVGFNADGEEIHFPVYPERFECGFRRCGTCSTCKGLLQQAYPIRYTFARTTTKVGELGEIDGAKMMELLCEQKGLSYDMALRRDAATSARLTALIRSANSIVCFTYTENAGGGGYLWRNEVEGMEGLVAGHRISMSKTKHIMF